MDFELSTRSITHTVDSSHQGPVEEDYEQVDPSLLPGLPNDIALQCLARVPRRCHPRLAMVCKRWKEMLLSREYYFLRKEMSLTEGWIYSLIRDSSEILHWFVMDPMERKWRELPKMPGDCAKRYGVTSEVLDKQLFVLGGLKKYQSPTSEVVKYDPVTNQWIEVANMETARCYFVCAAFDGQLYAVGGMGTHTGVPSSWEVYDSATKRWSSFEDQNIVQDLGEYLVFDRKLYIRHICPSNQPSDTAVFDPAQNSWAPVYNEMTKNWVGPTASAGDDMYMLDQTYGVKLMVLDKGTFTWKSLGRLAPISVQPPCGLAVVRRNLYLVGKGLRTTVIDMDRADDSGGFLVTSSFTGPINPDNMALSCHVIEM
ncbi:unnamed protein product [Calypogeia fissa]